MFEERRQSSKLLKPGSFDICKNATALMIVMLGHLELDMKVLDTDMKTTESDDCREILRNDRDANGMLAVT